VSEESSPFNLILLLNSIITISIILNQNENTKDSASKQNQSSSTNPLELITWSCVTFQLVLLLIKVKINNS
jgi:hypothetical protein